MGNSQTELKNKFIKLLKSNKTVPSIGDTDSWKEIGKKLQIYLDRSRVNLRK